MVFAAATAAIVILVIVTTSAVAIRFSYKRAGEHDRLKARMSWFGLPFYTLDVSFVDLLAIHQHPSLRVRASSNTPATSAGKDVTDIPIPETLSRWWPRIHRLIPASLYLLTRLSVKELSWITSFGTGEASHTGILTGLAWSTKSTLFRIASGLMRFESRPYFAVHPNFTSAAFATNVDCIVTVRVGHIMIAALKALFLKREV